MDAHDMPTQVLLRQRRAASLSTSGRDPRAATAPITSGVVAVSETCEYYGVADAISRCRAPRSCQDCLAMPGCGISSNGRCLNTTSESYEFSTSIDYRNAAFPNGSLISNTSAFTFLAGTATYCAATDPICTKCRDEFQRTANASTRSSHGEPWTAFCKGDNGCVCIGLCELPDLRTPLVADPDCDQPRSFHSVLPTVARKSQDRERRTACTENCVDGCMIWDAKCTDTTDVSLRDFRSVFLDSDSMGYVYHTRFASSNTTYCPASDATCAACRKSFPEVSGTDWDYVASNSYFCVGQDGCVCIQACEDERRLSGVYDSDCNMSTTRHQSANPVGSVFITAIIWAIMWVVYKVLTWKPRNRRHPQRNLWRNMLDEVPRVMHLDLFGWHAYREELLLREQELLHGLEITDVRPPVDFDHMDPSAPDFDDDDASAPTAHDPKALASAPVYRGSFVEGEGTADESSGSSPSAPDFDLEELEYELGDGSHGERFGLITRRSRRGQDRE